ncbi:MAG: DUF1697 domain-containing protein [Verrucomicrobiales bacterium]|nr:DUF1697 domain-containing protein [Verrucomicrobiales bacterium]
MALLRGINVSGRNKVPMKELVSLCADLEWKSVRTHLQTGNLVFKASQSASTFESELEQSINSSFGFSIPVIVRSAADLEKIVADSPFKNQAAPDPSHVLLYLTKRPIEKGALQYMESGSGAREKVLVSVKSLWIHFPKGVGSSKLTPSVIDRSDRQQQAETGIRRRRSVSCCPSHLESTNNGDNQPRYQQLPAIQVNPIKSMFHPWPSIPEVPSPRSHSPTAPRNGDNPVADNPGINNPGPSI